jgi:ribosome-associated protein
MQHNELLTVVQKILDDKKALDIKTIDVQGKTSVTDFMVIATGTSDRHLKSLSGYVVDAIKEIGVTPLGIEGDDGSSWVLVDLGDIILHLMTGQTREFYQLEKLWEPDFDIEAEQAG